LAYVLEPGAPVTREVRRAARERLDEAIAVLDGLELAEPSEVEHAVHEARKRCKEVRALARIARPAIGDEFDRCNDAVRDAAKLLAPFRDAHALLATLDDLRSANGKKDGRDLGKVRAAQSAAADRATRDLHSGDASIEAARQLLVDARKRVHSWKIAGGFAPLANGIEQTYGRGRKALKRARKHTTDENVHEWRKAVKNLWYQARLLERAAPSALEPMIATLDDLAEALGDDHDLAVLIERLAKDPHRFGGTLHAMQAIDVARAQQIDLRRRACRLGASVYAETPKAFADRMQVYWRCAVREGPELATGGIAELGREERRSPQLMAPSGGARSVERERRFLVAEAPELPGGGAEWRQGYLAVDGAVAVRVREVDGADRTLTIRAGRGDARVELAWPMSEEQFDTAWAQTRGRRIRITRYIVEAAGHPVAVDVFHDDLDGLVLAQVDFDSDEAMAAFEPPTWFSREVTDELAFTNASLAVNAPHGQPAT
jgi:CYTH domain-containing protein/CHAD domain-containing protein